MQRKILGMLLVGLATVLLVGIGADFASYTATRTATIAVVADDLELIGLVPVQGYAYITGEGMLKIDISSSNPNWKGEGTGISPSSEYDIDKVFNVKNNLWANDSTSDITVTVKSSNPTNIKLYSSLNASHHDSSTSAETISFDLSRGNSGDVGLHLIGPPSTVTSSITAGITVSAVKKP